MRAPAILLRLRGTNGAVNKLADSIRAIAIAIAASSTPADDAAIKAGKRLCGPFAWRDRPDFTCFQNASETASLARGVGAELGSLANTQAKPEVGPFAAPSKP